MTNNDLNHTLLQLQQLGLVDAAVSHEATNNAIDNQTIDNTQEHSPWFIQALFGFSGLLASLFFIGFLSLLLVSTDIFESMAGLLIVGLLLSAGGFALFNNNSSRNNTFISSLAFAISASGQAYIAFALLTNELPEPLGIWLLLLIQIVMTVIIPNFIYRLLSAGAVLSCLIYLLDYYHIPEVSLGLLALITVISNLQRYKLLQYLPASRRNGVAEVISALAYASAAMLLAVSVYFIAAEYGHSFTDYGTAFTYHYYVAQAFLTLASLYTAYLILRRYHVKLLSISGIISIVAILVLGALSVYVSGLLATSLVIVIAMANSQRVLLALGIAALVGYIFWYYYQLDTSLLIKSASMLAVGITLILMRLLLIKKYIPNSANDIDDNQERLL